MASYIEIKLTGHLDDDQLSQKLAAATVELEQHANIRDVIINCLSMDSYDIAARERFSSWNQEHVERIECMVIVHVKPVWRMVIAGMALAARREILSASTLDAAVKRLAER